jgi:hypothetical protein
VAAFQVGAVHVAAEADVIGMMIANAPVTASAHSGARMRGLSIPASPSWGREPAHDGPDSGASWRPTRELKGTQPH